MTQTHAPARLLGGSFLISTYLNLRGYELALTVSLRCCLYIPGLRHLGHHLVRRGFPRLPRVARDPRPNLFAPEFRYPVVGSFCLLWLFPIELAESIRDPIPDLLVVCAVLVHPPRNLQCHRGSGPPPRGDWPAWRWVLLGFGGCIESSNAVRILPPRCPVDFVAIALVLLG